MENKIYQLEDTEFIDLIKSSRNKSEVLFKLGLSTKGNSWGYGLLKRRMEELGLSGHDFLGRSGLKTTNREQRIPKEKLLSINSKHARNIVRRLILKEHLLEYKCAICGISTWNDKTLSLELDHINGINNDNRLENLRFLCPNCHSQTSTYGSRNSSLEESHYEVPEDLRNRICEEYLKTKKQVAVAKILGIKRKAVYQVLSEEGLLKSNQAFVIQYDHHMNEVKRFGSINDVAKYLIEANLLRTKKIKTARNSFLRNKDKFWCNSYWKIMDA